MFKNWWATWLRCVAAERALRESPPWLVDRAGVVYLPDRRVELRAR